MSATKNLTAFETNRADVIFEHLDGEPGFNWKLKNTQTSLDFLLCEVMGIWKASDKILQKE